MTFGATTAPDTRAFAKEEALLIGSNVISSLSRLWSTIMTPSSSCSDALNARHYGVSARCASDARGRSRKWVPKAARNTQKQTHTHTHTHTQHLTCWTMGWASCSRFA
eukprot:3698182-Rhodomonas_salina.2